MQQFIQIIYDDTVLIGTPLQDVKILEGKLRLLSENIFVCVLFLFCCQNELSAAEDGSVCNKGSSCAQGSAFALCPLSGKYNWKVQLKSTTEKYTIWSQ